MQPYEALKYCPLCKGDLSKQNANLLVCISCGYHLFVSPTPSNAVLIENEKREILLVERKREPQKGLWDFPGGFIDAPETLEDSVRREIKEELGIDVEMDKIIGVYPDEYLYQKITKPTLTIVVSAKVIAGNVTPADDVASYKFFSREEISYQKLAFRCVLESLKDYFAQKSAS